MTHRRALNAAEVARRLGVADKTVYRWIDQGRIPAHRIGGRVLIAVRDFEALLPESCASDCSCTCHGS